MSYIRKQDTNGVKPWLGKGEFGYDDYPAGGDLGRVWIGTGTENKALAFLDEVTGGTSDIVQVVADITERNALAPTADVIVYVSDASADPDITSGPATYVWDSTTTQWYRVGSSTASVAVNPGDMEASVYDPGSIEANVYDTDNHIEGVTNSVFTQANKTKLGNLTDNFKGMYADGAAVTSGVPTPVTGNYVLRTDTSTIWYYNGTIWVDTGSTSTGDMLATLYDPQNKAVDVYSMDNMDETATKKIFTDVERQALQDLLTAGGTSLPDQTGNTGKFLTTDGTDASWAAADALPDQTGNSGKVLTTNGVAASWDVFTSGVQQLPSPAVNSPADTLTNTSLTYTVSSIATIGLGTRTVTLSTGSTSISTVSASEGSASIVGSTIVVTGVTSASITITYQYTAVGTFNVSAKVATPSDANYSESNYSASDSISILLATPTLSAPADTIIDTNVAYTISNIDAAATKVIFDPQSADWTYVSSDGTASRVGDVIEVTAWSGTDVTVTLQYTVAATYTNRARVTDGTNFSAYATDSIVIASFSAIDPTGDNAQIAYYAFEGNANDTDSKVPSGTIYNGTASNVTYATGKVGQCAVFNGSTSMITASTGIGISYSVACWVYVSSLPGTGSYHGIFGPRNFGATGDRSAAYLFQNSNGKLATNNHTTTSVGTDSYWCNGDSTETTYVLPTGEWVHLVVTNTGSGGLVKIYANASEIFSETSNSASNFNNPGFVFGAYDNSGSNGVARSPLNGSIDEVRIFNRALTLTEIQTIYTSEGGVL
jgi:hypothetical protein